MRKEQHIPLFLWVATALVVHAVGGGGATEVVQRLEETLDIGSFASEVRRNARFAGPIEVTFETDKTQRQNEPPDEPNDQAPLDDVEEDEPNVEDERPEENPEEAKQPDEPEEKKPEEKAEEDKEKPEEKPPELTLAKKEPVVPNRRVSVVQHVEDKNQDDNPDAEFAGEHANRVKEQTQAQITATDQNALDPSAGQNHAGTEPDPGNSDEARVAQSDENDAPDDRGPGNAALNQAGAAAARSAALARNSVSNPSVRSERIPTPQEAQEAREATKSSEGRSAMVETHHHAHGTFGLSEAERAHAAQKKQEAVEKLNRVLARQKKNQDPLLGYGSTTTTERGIQLNLDQRMAAAVVGQDQLDNLQKEAGKRRLSQHRGSWKSLGLERWRGALENYVASVKPGNHTALNTARVPFSRYLNQIHQRLHEVFAHGFLGHLEQLPDKHPLNNQEMSTHVEIALSREDGRVVKMGITKSSGVTAFDVGALESVSKAAPYGPPPSSIVSSDGNVYLHWEFHRKRVYACSTYFARPYIIDVGPESAPPRVEPPRKPQPDEEKKPDERSGALEQDTPDQPRLRPG
jgi:TonB family protein